MFRPGAHQLGSVAEAKSRHREILSGLVSDLKEYGSWEAEFDTALGSDEEAYRALLRKAAQKYGERSDLGQYGAAPIELPPSGTRAVEMLGVLPKGERVLMENEDSGLLESNTRDLDGS